MHASLCNSAPKHSILARFARLRELVDGRPDGVAEKQSLQPFVGVELLVYGKLSDVALYLLDITLRFVAWKLIPPLIVNL